MSIVSSCIGGEGFILGILMILDIVLIMLDVIVIYNHYHG